MNRRRWTTQSRGRQTGCHNLDLDSLTWGHIPYPQDTPTWSRAMPHPLHSFKHTKRLFYLSRIEWPQERLGHGNVYYRFTEWHIKAPKEKHKSLYKGPEVVMLVDGTVSIFFNCNIPKQLSNTMILLKVKTRRWLLIAEHLVFFATKTYRNKDYK